MQLCARGRGEEEVCIEYDDDRPTQATFSDQAEDLCTFACCLPNGNRSGRIALILHEVVDEIS